jgi:L-fuconolactonase
VAMERSDALYDTHAHFFTNDLLRYPVNTANAREGEDNLRRRIQSDPATPERIFSLWEDSGVIGGVGVQYNTVYKTDNSFVLDTAQQHAERVTPVVMLDATAADTPSTLERWINERGVTGLRLFGRAAADGTYPWLDSPAALQTWQVVDRHALTMILMYAPASVAPAALEAIASLARRYPAATIALDHFGWAGWEPADFGIAAPLVRMREHGNVFYKVTTLNFRLFEKAGIDSAQFVRRAVDLFGADHIMWGSDVGNTLESYDSLACRAREAAALLTAAERALFLRETGMRLFGSRRVR